MKKIIILALSFLISSAGIMAQGKATKGAKPDTTMHEVYTCPMHPDVTSDKHGKCPKCGMDLNLSKKEQMKTEVMKIYTCSMHPDVTNDKPGKCPKCGMALIKKEQQ